MWEDNIRSGLREVGWEDVEWMHLARDRDKWWALVNAVMILRVRQKMRYFLTE
jgi:ketosteroid isomerase-like protein